MRFTRELTFLTRSCCPPKLTTTPTWCYIYIKTALDWKLQCRTALWETRRPSATELFPRPSFNSSQTLISDAHGRHKRGRHFKVWPGNEITWRERNPWERLLRPASLLTDRSTIDPVYEPLPASIIKACVTLELQSLRNTHTLLYSCFNKSLFLLGQMISNNIIL